MPFSRIGIYFETESLFTLDANSDFPLTILSSIAEQGSRTMSSSIKWGFQKRFSEGRLMMSTKNFLGYKMNNSKLEIVPEEAVIIRRIYEDFLSGKSMQNIAHELEEDKIPSPQVNLNGM